MVVDSSPPRLHIDGVAPYDLDAVRLGQPMRLRRTDRQPLAGRAPAGEDLAATGRGVSVLPLSAPAVDARVAVALQTHWPASVGPTWPSGFSGTAAGRSGRACRNVS